MLPMEQASFNVRHYRSTLVPQDMVLGGAYAAAVRCAKMLSNIVQVTEGCEAGSISLIHDYQYQTRACRWSQESDVPDL